jgi:hypothetical protein
MKLYADRDLIVSTVADSTAHRAQEAAAYLRRHFAADAKKAETAHKGPQAYSRAVRRGITAAVMQVRRLLHDPGCAEVVRKRIELAGPAEFGLHRVPSIKTIRAVLDALRLEFPGGLMTETPLFVPSPGGSHLRLTASTT